MNTLNFSDDVLKLNPQLSRPVVYRQKRVHVQPFDDFDSQLERDYVVELAARGWHVIPHPFTLHLPGSVDYTPDGLTWGDNCSPTIYECKGSSKAKNARDSRTRFKIAAGMFLCLDWVWVTRSKSGAWIEKAYKP